MVWAYMSAKPASFRSWTSAVWNAIHELGERPPLGLYGERRLDAVAYGAGELRQALSESCFEVLMTSRWRSCEGGAPALSPSLGVVLIVGPSEVVAQLAGDGVEVERRVEVVPAEYLEGGQVVAVLVASRSARRRYGAPRPRRSWRRRAGRRRSQAWRSGLVVRGRAFLSANWPRMRRRATTGRRFGSNLTKKMPQGWPGTSGRRRLISWIVAAFFASIPSSSGVYSKVSCSKSSESIGQPSSSRR